MVAKRSELGIRPKLKGIQSLLRVLVFTEELCEPVGILIRQRLQKHRVYDAEDGGVRSNSQRQRKDRHSGKSRAFQHYADGISKIVK